MKSPPICEDITKTLALTKKSLNLYLGVNKMTKERKQAMLEDIDNAVDAMLYECLVDIPQMHTGFHNGFHKEIVEHIITRIKNTHERYYDEEEDE
jgi:hypothetical protein